MTWTVVDLFAGAGGFSLGFRQAGFDVAVAVDNFRTATDTYALNQGGDGSGTEVRRVDVRDLDPDSLPEADVVVGGPPCEAFTPANQERRSDPLSRLHHDPMGSLTLQFIILLKALRPRVFVMENVPGLLEGPLEGELRDLFARAGYRDVGFHVLQALEHGTPSRRTRVFASNVRLEPPVTVAREDAPSVWEVIRDIEPLGAEVPNHEDFPLSHERRRRVAELDPGGSLYRYEAADGSVHHSWTRLRKDEVSPTVHGNSRFVHPTQPRLLTVREHARLMGYPDDYVFEGGRSHQYDLVGESVPPPLGKAVAGEVQRALDDGDL